MVGIQSVVQMVLFLLRHYWRGVELAALLLYIVDNQTWNRMLRIQALEMHPHKPRDSSEEGQDAPSSPGQPHFWFELRGNLIGVT